jgi:hypothetical protein
MGITICKNVCTLCPLYRPDQGDIVGREYIHSCKFLYPYGTSLGDSTIANVKKYLSPYGKSKLVSPIPVTTTSAIYDFIK